MRSLGQTALFVVALSSVCATTVLPAKASLPADAVASVNGHVISEKVYAGLLKNDQLAVLSLPDGKRSSAKLPGVVLNELIDRALITQDAEAQGVAPNESRIADEEKNILGSFGEAQHYRRFLAENNLTAEQYREEVIRPALCREALVQALARENPVTEEQVAAYYKANQQEPAFQLPERVAVAHINLNLGHDFLAARLQHDQPGLTNEALEKAVADEISRRRKLADNLLRQLREGADFAELAAKYSDDPGSRLQGGELPAFPRRAHPREFEDAAFAMKKPGDLGLVIEDFYGLHILKLREHSPARAATLAEASSEIHARLERENQATRFHDWLKAARAKAVIVKRENISSATSSSSPL